eukprot:m.16379 g.16379  ORF g.16379 m.16379 type:complete len:58 (+) comp26888_c0_seq1:1908-2081(+)
MCQSQDNRDVVFKKRSLMLHLCHTPKEIRCISAVSFSNRTLLFSNQCSQHSSSCNSD